VFTSIQAICNTVIIVIHLPDKTENNSQSDTSFLSRHFPKNTVFRVVYPGYTIKFFSTMLSTLLILYQAKYVMSEEHYIWKKI